MLEYVTIFLIMDLVGLREGGGGGPLILLWILLDFWN